MITKPRLAAMKDNNKALEYVEEKYQTEEICLDAIFYMYLSILHMLHLNDYVWVYYCM